MKHIKIWKFVGFIFILTSCNQLQNFFWPEASKEPEEVVKNFIGVSASAKDLEDKRKLGALCVGEMRRAFERMTVESFRLSYLSNKIKVREIKFVGSSTKGDQSKIAYRVFIENSQGRDATLEENEREVELSRSQGKWYIESIRAKGSDRIAFTRGMMF